MLPDAGSPSGDASDNELLQGPWRDEEDAIVTIRGSTLQCPGGVALQLTYVGDGEVAFSIGGERFRGRLADGGSRVRWDDGTSWLRCGPAVDSDAGRASGAADGALGPVDATATEASELRPASPMAEQPAAGAEGSSAPPPEAYGADNAVLVVRHAVEDQELKVVLPKRASFKHVRKALSGLLGCSTFKLVRRGPADYHPIKDREHVGDTRQVCVVCADIRAFSGREVVVAESEVSADEDEPAVSSSQAPGCGPNPADESEDVVRTPGEPFSRIYAIKLQKELLSRFRDEGFLAELRSLEARRGSDATRLAMERQELLLSVQASVLPRYGFEGTQMGVQRMMSEWGPFLKDPEFRRLTIEINDLLGIHMPPETWERRIEHFRRIVATTQPRERPRIAPGIVGRCMAITGGHVMGSSAPRCPVITDGVADLTASLGSSMPRPGAQAVRKLKPWPSKRPRPFKLSIAGTWDDYDPDEMRWEAGCFTYIAMVVQQEGIEFFQLLVNGEWGKTVYPSVPDASTFEEHEVLGPDDGGHGMNWCIGKLEQTRVGMTFRIVAQLDVDGRVATVQWAPHTGES